MSLSDLFIKRPVMTVLVMVGIVVFGFVAYTRLHRPLRRPSRSSSRRSPGSTT
jgi:hypothetical protein